MPFFIRVIISFFFSPPLAIFLPSFLPPLTHLFLALILPFPCKHSFLPCINPSTSNSFPSSLHKSTRFPFPLPFYLSIPGLTAFPCSLISQHPFLPRFSHLLLLFSYLTTSPSLCPPSQLVAAPQTPLILTLDPLILPHNSCRRSGFKAPYTNATYSPALQRRSSSMRPPPPGTLTLAIFSLDLTRSALVECRHRCSLLLTAQVTLVSIVQCIHTTSSPQTSVVVLSLWL